MEEASINNLDDIFPACRAALGPTAWESAAAGVEGRPSALSDALASLRMADDRIPAFLPDLARIEWARRRAQGDERLLSAEVDHLSLNPSLQLLRCSWKNLGACALSGGKGAAPQPEPGEEMIMVWRTPGNKEADCRAASAEDLLVLKMFAEGLDAEAVAAAGGIAVGAVDAAVDRAVRRGVLLSPPSALRRDASFRSGEMHDERFLSASVFTLQWHITQACDLHCKHCYDRSARATVPLDRALAVLDDLRRFCRSRHVEGQVSFTGGNPLLHPRFTALYRAAVERGFGTAILGNPTSRERLEELIAIQRPAFFQVSLEGLREQNDLIRGSGHCDRVMAFLRLLRELDVPSVVMLTLTEDNRDQVLPLAEQLRGVADSFTFNRLSCFGEGAQLQPVEKDRFAEFLESYARAAETNPVISLKDSLISIVAHRRGDEPFGGCAGVGCGAAFNFVALLPDGEVHACRKFPSPLGTILEKSLSEIYDSAGARRYREGCSACRGCSIRAVCGGCLAVASSAGLDVFSERDPYCFIEQ